MGNSRGSSVRQFLARVNFIPAAKFYLYWPTGVPTSPERRKKKEKKYEIPHAGSGPENTKKIRRKDRKIRKWPENHRFRIFLCIFYFRGLTRGGGFRNLVIFFFGFPGLRGFFSSKPGLRNHNSWACVLVKDWCLAVDDEEMHVCFSSTCKGHHVWRDCHGAGSPSHPVVGSSACMALAAMCNLSLGQREPPDDRPDYTSNLCPPKCAREGGRTLRKGVFLPSKRLLSAFYNAPPSKNPSKNLCLYWNPYKVPSKNPSKKHFL